MSKYTIRVKDILENYYLLEEHIPSNIEIFENSNVVETDWDNPFNTDYKSPFEQFYPTVDEVLDSTWNKIFDFNFPKLPNYENGQLEKVILKAYYMREIGFETVGRWKLALNQTLNRIMPYYIDLYNSIEFNKTNPLENYDLYDSSDRKTDSSMKVSSTSENTSNTTEKGVFEDTPSNELGAGEDYATNVTKATSEQNANNSNNGNSTNNVNDVYNRHAHGLMGYSKQDMIDRYRQNLINIDELIIMELSDLFMLLY